MKKLYDFVYEGRKPGSKNKPKENNQEPETLDDAKGLTAEENGSEGVWEIEPPTEDDITKGLDRETLTKNSRRVAKRLSAKLPFFIQGEAGWGKTSIITDVAHKFGYTVITVYLDKAEPEDLGGLPTAERDSKGRGYQANLLPSWAHYMLDNPKTKFLLFFDEMNQAQPAVMNALMPIVLKNVIAGKKFNNFIVGAAGNLEEENRGGISKLSGPLESRFGGIIIWESGDWISAMRFLRKKHGEKATEKFLDKVEECAPLFKNPRDVERNIIEACENIKEDRYSDYYSAEEYLDDLKIILKNPYEDLTRSQKEQLSELAEQMCDFILDKEVKDTKKKTKNRQMIPNEITETVIDGIKNGFIIYGGRKYGISKENIRGVSLDPSITKEMWDNFIDQIEIDGIKYKYETDEGWQKDGYEDPAAELIIGKDITLNKKEKSNSKKSKTRSLGEYVKEK